MRALAWVELFLAGLLEVAWAIGLKYTKGFPQPIPSLFTVLGMAGSFLLLSRALREIPVGTGYAVWTGIGAVGTAILGVVLFSESTSPGRVASILLIVAGIIGLRWTAP